MALTRAVVVVNVLTAASATGWWLGDQRRTANPQVRVIEVVDGDTLVAAFARRARDATRRATGSECGCQRAASRFICCRER